MRLTIRRTVQWGGGIFIIAVLFLNFYKRDEWSSFEKVVPWHADFQRSPEGELLRQQVNFDGQRFHQHLVTATGNKSTKGMAAFLHLPASPGPDLSNEIYPNERNFAIDRIVNQLKFVPEAVKRVQDKGEHPAQKTILLYHGFGGWAVNRGDDSFRDAKCAVQACSVTDDRSKASMVDAVLFANSPARPRINRPLNQVWILFLLESPYHTPSLSGYGGVFNWTATYRHDSTITAPYEKFVPFNTSALTRPQNRNYAEGKTKLVAWFVSNCGARNGRRQVADELGKHIQVDIYGACGTLKCPRYQSNRCFDMLNKDYKFYLAFENSNCRDYITEKFFVNGLQHDVVPIVMGAAPDDYRRSAPPHSFIHVDDFETAADLAAYLKKLDQNDDLYNEYFQWKGTGSFINTFFWCRICSLLHDTNRTPSSFRDVDDWWRGKDVCIGQERWRNRTLSQTKIPDS